MAVIGKKISGKTKEEILLSLLKKQRKYYGAILELGREEARILSKGQASKGLQCLIRKKKILFACIDEIEDALKPLKRFWKEKTDRSDPISMDVCQELVEIDLMLQALLQLDEANQEMLKNILSSLAQKKKLLV